MGTDINVEVQIRKGEEWHNTTPPEGGQFEERCYAAFRALRRVDFEQRSYDVMHALERLFPPPHPGWYPEARMPRICASLLGCQRGSCAARLRSGTDVKHPKSHSNCIGQTPPGVPIRPRISGRALAPLARNTYTQ